MYSDVHEEYQSAYWSLFLDGTKTLHSGSFCLGELQLGVGFGVCSYWDYKHQELCCIYVKQIKWQDIYCAVSDEGECFI